MRKLEIESTRSYILGNDQPFLNRTHLTAMLRRWRRKLGYYSIYAALPAMIGSSPQEARSEEPAIVPDVRASAAGAGIFARNLGQSCSTPEILRRRSEYRLPGQRGEYNIFTELAGRDDCPGAPIPSGTYTAAAPFMDSGTTVGADNTVNQARFVDYCYYAYEADGPDQIYSFTLTGFGSDPTIQVSTSSSVYRPLIYVMSNKFNRVGCPSGTGNTVCGLHTIAYAQNGTAALGRQSVQQLPLNVPLYLFIDGQTTGPKSSGPYTLRIQDVGIAPAQPPPPSALVKPKFDFDGDERADISVFRASTGFWWLNRSDQGVTGTQFGISTDKIVPADYDGDGKTDMAVYRDGLWLWLDSSTGTFRQAGWGIAADTPQPADYSGDGRAELTVFRAGTWFVYNIATGIAVSEQFGVATDRPVADDYDGDGRTDYAVYRDGVWYLQRSTQGFAALQFGLRSDKLVPADYDADGKTDLAVYRNGTWYVQRSLLGFTAFQFGEPSDIPVPGDYDGNGHADAAVFRDGVWYVQQSQSGFAAIPFGLANDKPVPAAFLP